MPRRIAISSLNASTIDILNTIRANSSVEYFNTIPEITKSTDIPKVGEMLLGYPALANQFINALLNRIAKVVIRSSIFNNPYKDLKKGELLYGESIEEIFVDIAKAREYNPEKAAKREFQRNLPDVKSAFHAINWRVQYSVTIEEPTLRAAFLSIDGVQDFIAKLVDSVKRAAEYDEYLLFKYLLIKNITKGKLYPVSIDTSDISNAGIEFRTYSNTLNFMSTRYNELNVHTNTPIENQYIFMDSRFNATYGVKVLAAAFNMDEATYIGKLKLIDDWTTFDNDRFNIIRANSDIMEEVTAEELELMKHVKAVLIDKEWFQIYDNMDRFTETYVGSGLYWNYFYNIWKTVSHSPFSNAVVFTDETATITLPDQIVVEIREKSDSEEAITFSLVPQDDNISLANSDVIFLQTETMTSQGIGIHSYGGLLIPSSQFATAITIELEVQGTKYTASTNITSSNNVGDTITCTKAVSGRAKKVKGK